MAAVIHPNFKGANTTAALCEVHRTQIEEQEREQATPQLSKELLEVHVRGFAGSLCKVSLHRNSFVRDLKCKIAGSTRIPTEEQRLLLDLCELNDHERLSSIVPEGTLAVDITVLRVDKEWQRCLEMVSIAGLQLAVASPAVQADRRLVMTAVQQNGAALEFADEALRADREAAGGSLPLVGDSPRKLKVVLAAVKDCGLALELASDLQGDPEVVMAAVGQCGEALRFATEELRATSVVVLAALHSGHKAFLHASPALRADRETVARAVQIAGLALEFVAPVLQAEKELVILAVQQDGLALEFASEELRADKEVVKQAVQVHGLALWDAADELRQDPEITAACYWGPRVQK